MKKLFTLLALTIGFSMNAQMSDNSSGTSATGTNAVAMGKSTTASGTRSTATGNNTVASGEYSTAMGSYTIASGWWSTAIGDQTTASGTVSTAMGSNTTASGNYSTAMGSNTTAGHYSTAMGNNTTAEIYSTAMGSNTTASGWYSTAMGSYTTASDYVSTVIGQYNSSGSSATSVNSFSTSAPAFVIGNGTNSSNKSDAFKVMFNGDTTVSNDLTVSGDVVISSDARLKSNIVSLGSTLSKLLLIDGKSYEKDGKQRIGVLAQEIQEVFPELVSEDDNEMLAVNYQGLVPILINALKEQDIIIKSQEERLTNIENQLAKLNE